MENKQSFGRFICDKRKAAGLTQQQLADRVFVTESAVSKWERGLSYPDITMIPPLCEALGVSERELITASDDKRQAVVERDAGRYRRLRRGYLLTTYILYGGAQLACAVADLADGHGLSWSFIVLSSLTLAFTLTDLPLLLETHRAVYTLFAFFAGLNLLVLTCNIYYGCAGIFPTVFMALLFSFTLVFLPFVLKAFPLRGPPPRAGDLSVCPPTRCCCLR